MNNKYGRIKKIIIILLVLLSYFSFPLNVFALDQFIKNPSNPLTIDYISDYNSILQVHVFKQENLLKGIFTVISNNSSFAFALGEPAGENKWKLTKEILKFNQEVGAPRLYFTSPSEIKLYFTKKDSDRYRIYSVDCDANFNCNNRIDLVLDSQLPWETKGVFSAFPYFKLGTYFLFYGAWAGSSFQIAMATSNDGKNWTKCPNNPLFSNADGPFLLERDNKFYLFYHGADGSGIKMTSSTDSLSCSMKWSSTVSILLPDKPYDSNHLIAPSLIEQNNNLYLYYSGRGNDAIWKLNFATSALPHNTIVLIPGFFASWNKDALLHNKNVSIFDWKLPSYITEYSGIIESLKNLGLKENEDFVIFPYDWRKHIEDTTNDLLLFLNTKIWNKNPDEKIQIVGYSLGGLIGRIYAQKYGTDKINKIISIGSPHKGVAQVYKPLEAGEIDRDNSFLWLMEKFMLVLNKDGSEADKDITKRILPVLLDLLPTFDYLKENDKTIKYDSLSLKNSLLLTYNGSFDQIFPKFTAIYGEKNNETLAGYYINERSISDKLFNNYTDGRPEKSYQDFGDDMVLSSSSKEDKDPDFVKLPFDHGELITKKEGIEKIFDTLNLSYNDEQIVPGKKTDISPSLIFVIQSPGQMQLTYNNQVFEENDGIIFIPNAQPGKYKLDVKGTDLGNYTVTIGQISQNTDVWEKIQGQIIKTPPNSQVDTYNINFDNINAKPSFPTPIPTQGNLAASSSSGPGGSNFSQSNKNLKITPTNNRSKILSKKESAPEVKGIFANEQTKTKTKVLSDNKTKYLIGFIASLLLFSFLIYKLIKTGPKLR